MRNHLPFIPLVVLMTMLLSLPSAYGYDLGDGFHSIKISAMGENRIVPRPRPRPIEVLMLAAASKQIEPASAPIERQNSSEDSLSPVRGSLGPVTIASLASEELNYADVNVVYSTAKGSLHTTGTTVQATGIRPLSVSYANTSSLSDLFTSTDAIARRDGTPQPFVNDDEHAIHPLSREDKSAVARLIEAFMPGYMPGAEPHTDAVGSGINRSGKGDSQVVNRSGKGNFPPEAVGTQNIWQQSEAQSSISLKVVEAPLSFGERQAAYKDGRKLFYDRLSAGNSSEPNIAIATKSDAGLCYGALNAGSDAWGALEKHVKEAKRRNLKIDDCRVALGLTPLKNMQSKKQAGGTYPVPTDDTLAYNSPDKTDWKAAFSDGLAAYNNGLTERAYKIWSRLAEAGDADAQCHLGLMFQQGIYVTRSDRAAENWFRMALDRGLKRGTGCEFAAKKAASNSKPASLQDLDEKTTSPSNLLESKRIALVIGNNDYKEIPALDNPANDARDMAAALKSLGFEVITALDANRFEMENKLADFAKSARTADVAVAFYAGHGMQHEGINYLIPVDGQLTDETDLRRFIKLRSVIEDMQSTKGVRILIVDACRDNEALTRFAGSLPKTRSMAYGKGLADEGAEGVLVAYATQPGKVAVDEAGGKNSPFTAAILKHIKTANTDIRVMFTRVRKDVLEATEYKQRPEVSDSLSGEFSFN